MSRYSSSGGSSGGGAGIGFFGLLGIVFIVLKLLGKIEWPWVWVLSPIWGSIVLYILVVIVIIWFFNKRG